MKIQKTTYARVAMLALLGGVVYQGLTFATGFEVSQKLTQLRHGTAAEQNVQVSLSAGSNAASLYMAAAQFPNQRPFWIQNGVDLALYQENRQAAEAWANSQRLALELLGQATTMKQCHWGQEGLNGSGQVNYVGMLQLVQVACLEMMVRAESGQSESAIKLGQDVSAMIQNLETSPTAIRHTVSLTLANQLGRTVKELSLAYPEAGFRGLRGSLRALADRLDSGLAQAPIFEREVAVVAFENLRDGVGEAPDGTQNFLSRNFDLLSYHQELDYLTTSEQIESALANHKLGELQKIATRLQDDESLTAALTPNWSVIAVRHQQVVKMLRI